MNSLWFSADNKGNVALIVDADNNAILCDTCPCPPCPPTTKTIVMSVNGISICQSFCFSDPPDRSFNWTLGILPTVTCPYSGIGIAGWKYVDPIAATQFGYPTTDCSGPSDSEAGSDIFYNILCGDNQWEVEIVTQNPQGIFYAAGTGALPINTVIPNQLIACGNTSIFPLGALGFGGGVKLTLV